MERSWRRAVTAGLLVLVGVNLRTALLGVPPILPLLAQDLRLSYTEIGLLTSLPTLVMGIVSLPLGILIGYVGGRRMVAIGLALLALGAFLRALWPAILPLYIFTAFLGLGSASAQTALPALIRQWFSSTRIGFATALYSDGLVIGETLGASLTLPLMVLWLGRDAWAASFVFWSVPIVLTLLLWLWLAPASEPVQEVKPSQVMPPAPARVARGPLQISAWTLSFIVGGGQLIYFGMNGWIAPYNQAIHASALTSLALGSLNAVQLPAAFALTFFADRLVGRRSPFVVCSALCLGALAGWFWAPAFLEPLWTGLIGATTISIYTLGIALPALLAEQGQVARWTGIMLTVGYLYSFLGSSVGGWLWDATGVPATSFLPVALAMVILLALSLLLPLNRAAILQSA